MSPIKSVLHQMQQTKNVDQDLMLVNDTIKILLELRKETIQRLGRGTSIELKINDYLKKFEN